MKKMIELTNDRYRLGYHVSAPAGWINDPNGFVTTKDTTTSFINITLIQLIGGQCIGAMPEVKI